MKKEQLLQKFKEVIDNCNYTIESIQQSKDVPSKEEFELNKAHQIQVWKSIRSAFEEASKVIDTFVTPNTPSFTRLYDSFGTPIFEGDEIEYFDYTYANYGCYKEEDYCDEIDKLPEGFIDRALSQGYKCKHEWKKSLDGTKCLLMCKPKVGVVKWNQKYGTYEPLIDDDEDYHDNCFIYLINKRKDEGKSSAYCKVIKSSNNAPH